MDSKLTFSVHVSKIHSKISQIQGLFFKLSLYLPLHILISLYYALIYSNLTYCIEAWGSAPITTVNKLFIVQKKVIKLIFGLSIYDSSSNLFKLNNFLKLKDIYKLHCLVYMYNNFHLNKSTKFCSDILQCQINQSYSLRNSGLLRLPKIKRIRCKQSLMYQGIKLWNALPNLIRLSKSKCIFKKLCKSHLQQTYL